MEGFITNNQLVAGFYVLKVVKKQYVTYQVVFYVKQLKIIEIAIF